MELEVYNLMIDWSIALVSLHYAYHVGMFIAQGTTRLLALFPVICLFICLPLNLNCIFFAGPITFFMSWLGSFKLILYAFDQGPLSSSPPLPLSHFIFTACLPIKIIRNQETPSHQIPKISHIDYAPRVLLLILVTKAYGYKDYLHPSLTMSLIIYYLLFMFILLLAMGPFLVRTLLGVEVEPQFDEPHHATSVQNFWGKRWNLMSSDILRLTVYSPARIVFSHVVPDRWVSVPAVVATFVVSGMMHEMMLYHLGQVIPTWEVTWFFIVNGVWVRTEIIIKKSMGQKFDLPPMLAWLLTLMFISVTGLWLLLPPLLRLDPHACQFTLRGETHFNICAMFLC